IEAIERGKEGPDATGAMRPLLLGRPIAGVIWAEPVLLAPVEVTSGPTAGARGDGAEGLERGVGGGRAAGDERGDEVDTDKERDRLQRAMTAGAGVVRSAASLAETGAVLDGIATGPRPATAAACELRNLRWCARALLAAATAREE